MSISTRDYSACFSAEYMASIGCGIVDEPAAIKLSRKGFTTIHTVDDALSAATIVAGSYFHREYESMRTRFVERLRMLGFYGDVMAFFLAQEEKMVHTS